METFEAVLIGLIQGLAEFFPVSSSGHLKLAQYFLGFTNLENLILFDLVCHLGTLAAILIIFRKEILALFKMRGEVLLILTALLPLFPLLLFIKPIKESFGVPAYWGYFFLITSLFLFLSEKIKLNPKSQSPFFQALLVGCAQAFAVFPGVSRSGATIATAQILGWERVQAARFSFLLAIPTILGGAAYEGSKLLIGKESAGVLSLNLYLIGFFFSFLSGLFALLVLMKLVELGRLAPFKWYCLALGLASIYYFNF